MTQTPPAPIMDSGVDTKGHDFVPGWIRKYWGSKPEHAPTFKPGTGAIRRPDVVIVKDGSKPPTQDNIKQAFIVSKMAGLDAGSATLISVWPGKDVENHIINVGWLTAINHIMVDKAGGLASLRSELPVGWFAKYDYDKGIVIQAGPEPEIAPIEPDPKPAIDVLPAMALNEVRLKDNFDLHYGSKDGEPRLTGLAATEWFTRFDASEDELMRYKTKLLSEPKLTKETTLPSAL